MGETGAGAGRGAGGTGGGAEGLLDQAKRLRDDPWSDPRVPRHPVLERFWATAGRVPRYLKLLLTMVKDPRVPARSKGLLLAGGAYAVSPIDLVPGLIPVAGQLDDLAVLLLGLRQALRACPPDVAADLTAAAGLSLTDLDDDLRTVRDTAAWAAINGAKAGGRLALRGGRALAGLARRGAGMLGSGR